MANLSSYLPDGIDESSVQITGGTINGTTIGASTPSTGAFTTFTSNGIDDNADATAITIDSSERVLIGTDSGDAFNDSASLRIQNASGASYIQVKTPNDQSGGLLFGDTDDDFRGGFFYDNSTDHLAFYANDAERMRIDSSGRIGLGGQPATTNGLITLQSDAYYSDLVELYGSGDKKTYIAGRIGILGNNSFVTKIGGVYGGYAGLSFDYYYLYPLIQESMNNGDLRLGSSSYRFHTLYSVNGTSTSDERVKEEVENLDVGLDFIKSLQPKKFKYKDKDEEGNYKDGRLDQPDGVKKWGLIAQDVKQVLDDNSITEDLGLWSVDKGECNGEILEDQQQLQYQELIAPLINAVKEQQALIETLQTEVAELKAN